MVTSQRPSGGSIEERPRGALLDSYAWKTLGGNANGVGSGLRAAPLQRRFRPAWSNQLGLRLQPRHQPVDFLRGQPPASMETSKEDDRTNEVNPDRNQRRRIIHTLEPKQ